MQVNFCVGGLLFVGLYVPIRYSLHVFGTIWLISRENRLTVYSTTADFSVKIGFLEGKRAGRREHIQHSHDRCRSGQTGRT